jgi:hypothetical protein
MPGTLIQRFIGGPNIVFLTGPDWRRHRKVIHYTHVIAQFKKTRFNFFFQYQDC